MPRRGAPRAAGSTEWGATATSALRPAAEDGAGARAETGLDLLDLGLEALHVRPHKLDRVVRRHLRVDQHSSGGLHLALHPQRRGHARQTPFPPHQASSWARRYRRPKEHRVPLRPTEGRRGREGSRSRARHCSEGHSQTHDAEEPHGALRHPVRLQLLSRLRRGPERGGKSFTRRGRWYTARGPTLTDCASSVELAP